MAIRVIGPISRTIGYNRYR